MRNGVCPECNSNNVYHGKGYDSAGLRDQHIVFLRVNGSAVYVDTYVCLACGAMRLYVAKDSQTELAKEIRKDNDWVKAA